VCAGSFWDNAFLPCGCQGLESGRELLGQRHRCCLYPAAFDRGSYICWPNTFLEALEEIISLTFNRRGDILARLSWTKGIPNAVTEAEQRCLRQGGEGWSALWAPRVKIGRPSHRQFGDGPSFDAIQCRPMNLISLSHHGKFEISCYKQNYHQVRRTKLLVLSWRSAFLCLTVRGLNGGFAVRAPEAT
jgi:hypothetical protein